MKPVVFMHAETEIDDEGKHAARYLPTFRSRMLIPQTSLVVARYGLLPHYQEWESDLAVVNSKLVNSYQQHKWIADLTDWGGPDGVLSGLTPKTWTRWSDLPAGMSFVVKGRTNSKKQSWNTRMFAASRDDVPALAARLRDDELLNDQGIVAREYIPLKQLDEGLNGLPIVNEHRTFWIKGLKGPVMLSKGYYWQYSHPESADQASFSIGAFDLAYKAAKLVAEHVNFFVLDLAETAQGDWIVIEVNDGSMSGLCGCSADDLYSNMARALGVHPDDE